MNEFVCASSKRNYLKKKGIDVRTQPVPSILRCGFEAVRPVGPYALAKKLKKNPQTMKNDALIVSQAMRNGLTKARYSLGHIGGCIRNWVIS